MIGMDNVIFNASAIGIWEKYFEPAEDLFIPLILPPLVHGGVLFVGINPSFSPDGFKRCLTGTPFAEVDPQEFFHWRNRGSLDLEKAIQIEQYARDRYPYFNKFRDISSHIGLPWEHVDLFLFRETSQNSFKRRIIEGGKLTPFALEQLELCRSLIEEIDPKVIVVVNAFASNLFVEIFGAEFDERFGYHLITLNARSIPVFLASMLTGQRAMDRYSYQRLRWQIKRVVENIRET
jgi:hypothetical protein